MGTITECFEANNKKICQEWIYHVFERITLNEARYFLYTLPKEYIALQARLCPTYLRIYTEYEMICD